MKFFNFKNKKKYDDIYCMYPYKIEEYNKKNDTYKMIDGGKNFISVQRAFDEVKIKCKGQYRFTYTIDIFDSDLLFKDEEE